MESSSASAGPVVVAFPGGGGGGPGGGGGGPGPGIPGPRHDVVGPDGKVWEYDDETGSYVVKDSPLGDWEIPIEDPGGGASTGPGEEYSGAGAGDVLGDLENVDPRTGRPMERPEIFPYDPNFPPPAGGGLPGSNEIIAEPGPDGVIRNPQTGEPLPPRGTPPGPGWKEYEEAMMEWHLQQSSGPNQDNISPFAPVNPVLWTGPGPYGR